jgi:ligand-binding SRPBCC domain-containing protein
MSAASPPAGVRAVRVLRSHLWVPAPPAQVWPFFSAAQNLRHLTPPWLRFEIERCPVELGVDSRIDYRIRLRGLPLRWRTRIARWEPGRCFVDEQERGPYRLWEHTHGFDPLDGGTVLTDAVAFAVRGGPFAGWIRRFLVEPDLLRIFRFRLERIAERFGGDAASGAVRIEDPGLVAGL